MKQLTRFWSLRKEYCLFTLFIFASCSVMDDCPKEQTGDVRLSLNVTPGGWDSKLSSETTRASYSALAEGSSGNKTFNMSFTSGDAIGLFACDKDGKVVIANHKWSYSGSAWTTESPIASVSEMGDYTYFAYYPWVASLSGAPTLNSTPDISSGEAFFASTITAWTPATDQSTIGKFTSSDLMVAKGTASMPYLHEIQVSFDMVRQMGLAVTKPDLTFYDINDPSYTWTVTQSFTGNIPYQIGSNYYYIVKPGVETTIGAKSTTLAARQVELLFFPDMEPGRVERSENTMTLHSGKVELSNPITYQYSTNGGSSFSSTKPSWLTVNANVVEGEPTEFEVYATPASASSYRTYSDGENSAETAALKTNTAASNVDLSMVNNDGSARADGRTTANCYLVHASGTYKIPLVYGNAIKDGNTNRNAYYTTKTSNTLQNFVNHNDAGIYTGPDNDETDPWIKNHSITVAGAKLIWQDVQGMISSVGISGDYLTFTVDPDHIAPGNAVIAATTGANGTGDIVWSWHIWVTTETLSNLTTISAAHTYQLAPVNVGWISSTVRTYTGNTCRVQASSNGVTLTFDVTQASGSMPIRGYYPYYQWGRKDALIPSTGSGNYNHKTWDIDGNVLTSSANNTCYSLVSGAYSIGTTIKNPIRHYCNTNKYVPYKETKYNYWDAENTALDNSNSTSRAVATVKTVYDPCPPDFCVPTSNCFYYIYSNYSSYFTWSSSPAGRTWKMSSANVFFPASGYRGGTNGTLNNVGSYGCYWTATPYSTGSGRPLRFLSDNIYWSSDGRASGYAVRAVAEE